MLPLFASTLFVTSALLFVLEPLVAKGLLPVLGGGAAVWTTSVAFFQLALLAGYLYAHLAPSWLPPRRHAVIHVVLLACAAILLPLREPAGLVAPAAHQAIWLFGRLAVSIGPAFVLLAATAPLVQRWLASTGHHDARDPYFLYAASNAGSLLALAAYPILLEPLAGLDRQRRLWMGGLALAVVLLAASAAAAWRAGLGKQPPPADDNPSIAGTEPAPSSSTRLRWLVLAAVPSSLLLSVTSYLTTDVVAMPLLWVMPLALYLLTFILAFARRTLVSPQRVVWIQAFFLVPLAAEMFMRTEASATVLVPLHTLAFFVTALVCHQALARSRPTGARSTEFYLYVAAGGALGGLFNVFAAPLIFKSMLEYPIGLVAAALLRPAPEQAAAATPRQRRLDLLLPLGLAALLVAGVRAALAIEARAGGTAGLIAVVVLVTATALITYSFRWRPLRFGLALAAIMASGATYEKGAARTVHSARSFYGRHKVVLDPPSMLVLWHGNTTHGAQDLTPARRREPLTYYHPTGPIGAVMAAWQGRPQRRRVGVIGLGVGSLSAYADPGEHWTFFEIDPRVIDIARDRSLFTFLGDARGDVEVVPGDGRLSLAAVPDGTFGMLVLDAFSSDAVPAHLLTREAFALCLRKLAPGGVIAVHVSNRYLDLGSVVAGSAGALDLSARIRFDPRTPEEERAWRRASIWMLLARSNEDLAPIAADPRWRPVPPTGLGWTDDASNLWGVFHAFGR